MNHLCSFVTVSSVFSESMVTFCTSEKQCGAFVAASSLHLPYVSEVVSAFWTGFSSGWQCSYLMFFSNHGYRFVGRTLHALGRNSWSMFPRFFVTTFWAYHLKSALCSFFFTFRNQARSTVWTKIHYTHRSFFVISLRPTIKFFSFINKL